MVLTGDQKRENGEKYQLHIIQKKIIIKLNYDTHEQEMQRKAGYESKGLRG